MSGLPPEAAAALSRSLAQLIVREVAACGGEVADVLTVASAVTARIICMAVPPDPESDAAAARIMGEQIARCVPVSHRSEREGVVS